MSEKLEFLDSRQLIYPLSKYSELLAHKFSGPVDFYSDEKVALTSFLEISINEMKFLKHYLPFLSVLESTGRIWAQNLKF